MVVSIYIEPGLESIVKTTTTNGFLRASVVPQPADVFIIAVPTPLIDNEAYEGTPKPDVSYIKSAAIAISKVLKKGRSSDIRVYVTCRDYRKASWLAGC
jgi:UDP-N-acetyl-D-mannosaminuronic acid dehydrogenase